MATTLISSARQTLKGWYSEHGPARAPLPGSDDDSVLAAMVQVGTLFRFRRFVDCPYIVKGNCLFETR